METTLTKLTVAEMEANPAKWERFELYKGEPLEMTYTKPNHARILMRIGAKIQNWIDSSGKGAVYGGEGEGGVEGEAVDAVFGFHVHRVAVRVGQNPPHRRRHHPVPVRFAEDHHPSTHHGIADQQAVIDPAQAATRLFFGVAPVLTDLSCRDVYHRMTAAPDRPFYGGLRAAPQLCCKGATCLHFVSC